MIVLFLTIISVFNVGFGVWALVNPPQVMEMMLEWQGSLSTSLDGVLPATTGEFRAVFGGMFLMLGLTTLRALWSPRYAEWLQPLAWIFLGLALARFSSLIVEGFATYTIVAGTIEVATAWMLGVHAQRLLQLREEGDDHLEEEHEEEYEA
ncbi:MAG: DUF4345 domain-containing protein [Planctomycetia bacterium]|jgi:hypothetical protein|nr:DUF4345 domain-containing protein [Planctomycetia bacterium]NCF99945.1 DUF4345 domain-containing protein [Planctomycetia bacterium]